MTWVHLHTYRQYTYTDSRKTNFKFFIIIIYFVSAHAHLMSDVDPHLPPRLRQFLLFSVTHPRLMSHLAIGVLGFQYVLPNPASIDPNQVLTLTELVQYPLSQLPIVPPCCSMSLLFHIVVCLQLQYYSVCFVLFFVFLRQGLPVAPAGLELPI